MPHFDVSQDLGACPDHYAVPYLWMPVFPLFAGATERHTVQHRNIVADLRRLADDHSGGVIEENAATDLRRRMDVALERRRYAALQVKPKIAAALVPQPMHQAVRRYGLEALVIEHRLDD